jgi:hypothetical protein
MSVLVTLLLINSNHQVLDKQTEVVKNMVSGGTVANAYMYAACGLSIIVTIDITTIIIVYIDIIVIVDIGIIIPIIIVVMITINIIITIDIIIIIIIVMII